MLIDPPSATGLPHGHLTMNPLPSARGRMTVIVVAVVGVALFALAGVAVALDPGQGSAGFPYTTLVTPFHSPTASPQPGSTASPSAHPTTPGPNAMIHPSKMPTMTVTPSPTMTTWPATASASTMATPSASATQPAVTVTYVVLSAWNGHLVAKVRVTNTGFSAISGWQIVVALPYDQFTAVSDNATGYASNHILVLRPETYADSVPADGTLSVFFTAYGPRTTPELCAFNVITCG